MPRKMERRKKKEKLAVPELVSYEKWEIMLI